MKIQTLASGSKGNCTLLINDDEIIIIDMGIPYLTLKKSLEENSLCHKKIEGILITHNHQDHIKGLKSLIAKTDAKVYIPEDMYDGLSDAIPKYRCEFIDGTFLINNISIELIHTSHDAPCSVGYIITCHERSLIYITDTGYINRKILEKITNKNLYLIESNHDEIMLMDGPYPRFLKERVISDKGHLSNNMTARYLKKIIGNNTKNIILAHLSETNNTEDLAYETISQSVGDKNINITIARQNENSQIIEV